MHNSTEHEISTAHKLKKRQIIKKFLALSLSGVVFIILINVKMPTIVGIFNIYEQHKYYAQLSWKTFYKLGACFLTTSSIEKKETILILVSLKTLFFASWKFNS